MSAHETHQAMPPPGGPTPLIERVTEIVAMLGGLLALCIAFLVCASVLGRWLFNAPVEGDFEFVKMATAIAIFAYLPYTQTRRGHIMVDTFTGWLPRRTCQIIDAFWDLILMVVMGLFAAGLAVGATEAFKSGETTMQVQLVVWPSIACCAVLCALLVVTAFATALRLMGGRS